MSRFLIVIVAILAGVSGCLGVGMEGDGGPEDSQTEDDRPEEADETETDDKRQVDRDWTSSVSYDYVRGSEAVGTIDVPGDISSMLITVEFLYWPTAASSPGVCDSQTELVIEVTGPDDEARVAATFDENAKTGNGGEACSEPEILHLEDPEPGEWTVSFTGEGVTTGRASFDGN